MIYNDNVYFNNKGNLYFILESLIKNVLSICSTCWNKWFGERVFKSARLKKHFLIRFTFIYDLFMEKKTDKMI